MQTIEELKASVSEMTIPQLREVIDVADEAKEVLEKKVNKRRAEVKEEKAAAMRAGIPASITVIGDDVFEIADLDERAEDAVHEHEKHCCFCRDGRDCYSIGEEVRTSVTEEAAMSYPALVILPVGIYDFADILKHLPQTRAILEKLGKDELYGEGGEDADGTEIEKTAQGLFVNGEKVSSYTFQVICDVDCAGEIQVPFVEVM